MPQPTEVPTFELRADDLFALDALRTYQRRLRAAGLNGDYEHRVADQVQAFEDWRRSHPGDVSIPMES